MRNLTFAAASALSGLFAVASPLSAEPFGMKSTDRIALVHAEGAQIYECQADALGSLRWRFKEPIASLFENGKTIGRHYAGPTWMLADGTVVTAKVVAQAPAATSGDIPELMLTVISSKGDGAIAAAGTIVRMRTRGGVAQGSCQTAGEFLSVSYSADYAFFAAARNN